MAEAVFNYFSDVLGSVDECAFSINKSLLRGDSFDLSELEAPFTEEEIWRAVRSLPTSKAPGPDGFMAEFLRACSDIIKHSICEAFEKFYTVNGRGFQKLNEASSLCFPSAQMSRPFPTTTPLASFTSLQSSS